MIFTLGNAISVLDIIIVTVILYWLMLMFKGTRAERMLWGLVVVVVMYFVSQRAELLTLHWILSNFLGSIVIFIIVLFQQDIRRALVQVGKSLSYRDSSGSWQALEEITRAASAMSAARTGGIIVMERSMDLSDFLQAGVVLDARLSRELLLTIFKTPSPMHDGAVVVRGSRLFKAGCILPLAEKELAGSMGTRHRAAIGLAEETDAVVVVVSEQTGEITVVVEDAVHHDLSSETLLDELKKLFSGQAEFKKKLNPWRYAP